MGETEDGACSVGRTSGSLSMLSDGPQKSRQFPIK